MSEARRWEINERILKIIEEGRKKFEMFLMFSITIILIVSVIVVVVLKWGGLIF